MGKIQKIHARMIYDSRGNPTVEVDLTTEKGLFRAAVPSGASTGIYEALEMRDGDKAVHHGKGVLQAIGHVNNDLAPAVIAQGFDVTNQTAIDEFMILPTGASSFSEACRMGTETYHHLKAVIKSRFGLDATSVGGEGGFAPNILENKAALELIQEAIAKAGYTGKIEIGMDVAASEFCKDKKYDLDFKNPNSNPNDYLTSDQLADVYKDFVKNYPVVSIEDPFDQDDWAAYSKMTADMDIQIVGDDLLVTNPKRVQKGIDLKAANALLLKVNQIGSVTESIEACKMSQKAGWGVMVSHRSGETEDTFIADLVVGLCTGQIKTGAPCRSERLAKYNQLLRIEEELGDKAKFAGKNYRHPC